MLSILDGTLGNEETNKSYRASNECKTIIIIANMGNTSTSTSRRFINALLVNESSIGRNSLKSSLGMINSMKLQDARTLKRGFTNEGRPKVKTISTIEAATGGEAINITENNDIDLVFAYHSLPDMSGIELLGRIRNNPKTALLPFILVTEVPDRIEFVNAVELGASDYLLMPYSLQSLEERVNRALEPVKTQLVQWRKQLSVGNEEIDRQHKRLINLINEMYNSLVTGRGKDTIRWVMDELVDYTKTHFGYEESFMAKIEYPYIAEHLHEHEGLTEQVLELSRRSMLPDVEMGLVLETLNFLKDWLMRHIIASDLKCIKYAKSEGFLPSEHTKFE